MSSTTRVGFLVPVVGDQADETLYHDNNITVLEAELPSLIVGSLPGSGAYTGQIKTTASAAAGNYLASMPEATYVWNGSAWVTLGSFGMKKSDVLNTPGSSNYITSSGSEVFSSVLPSFSSINAKPNTIVRFCCQCALGFNGANGDSAFFNAKFNIFVNPNSSTQPTPTTPGVVRLSFPMLEGDNTYTPPTPNDSDNRYGELLYAPGVTTAQTLGVAAYLSATRTKAFNGVIIADNPLYNGYNSVPTHTVTINAETIGLM